MPDLDPKLVAQIWQRVVTLGKAQLLKEMQKTGQPTVQGVYADLARCFMSHNPGATVFKQASDRVALDITNTQFWQDDQADNPPGLRQKMYKDILTGNGLLEFFASDTEHAREFLFQFGGASKMELQLICDNWVERQWSGLGEWLKSFDTAYPKSTPFLVKVIANLNPLTAGAKIVAALQGTELFTGKAITDDEKVGVCIEGVFSVVEAFGSTSGQFEGMLTGVLHKDKLFRDLCIKACQDSGVPAQTPPRRK
jgi:hypothetical protein